MVVGILYVPLAGLIAMTKWSERGGYEIGFKVLHPVTLRVLT